MRVRDIWSQLGNPGPFQSGLPGHDDVVTTVGTAWSSRLLPGLLSCLNLSHLYYPTVPRSEACIRSVPGSLALFMGQVVGYQLESTSALQRTCRRRQDGRPEFQEEEDVKLRLRYTSCPSENNNKLPITS
jgi:hypothetical protein